MPKSRVRDQYISSCGPFRRALGTEHRFLKSWTCFDGMDACADKGQLLDWRKLLLNSCVTVPLVARLWNLDMDGQYASLRVESCCCNAGRLLLTRLDFVRLC